MALLARGSVTDRPWGLTFGALGVRGLTGELTVVVDGKTYRVAFHQGAIVAAHSPLASDAAVRIALTGNLITSTQVADITRRMAASPDHDEVELLASIARLSPEQAQRLRRRLVANRAARVFSVERGTFTVDDEFTLPVYPGSELDIRAVCYLGAKNNFSEERMGDELTALGGWFQLKPEAVEDLGQYGFTAVEQPAIQMLLEGADLAEVEKAHPSIGARAIRAVAYALVSCAACEIRQAQRRAERPAAAIRPAGQAAAAMPRTTTREPAQAPVQQPGSARPTANQSSAGIRVPMASQGSSAGIPRPMASSGSVGTSRPGGLPRAASQPGIPSAASQPGSGGIPHPGTQSGSGGIPSALSQAGSSGARPQSSTVPQSPRARTPSQDAAIRMRTPTGQTMPTLEPLPEQRPARTSRPPPTRRAKRNSTAISEIEQLLAAKLPLLDGRADHFTLLGLKSTATVDEIRQSYFLLARKLHPDRLSAIGVDDEARNAQRLMAQLNAAFAVLNDPTKRAEYASVQGRGGEAVVRAENAQADELASRIMRAEEAFRIGEMAMRRDSLAQAVTAFQEAVTLQPNESEYQALLAWAQFAAATDKNAIAGQTRRQLTRAAEANDRSPTARFYLGRVERMLGKEREALQHFHEVLRIKPTHADAASEARVLESRLKGKR